MSNKGKMIEAIYAACLTTRATLVIFYLINRANQELTCFPSVKTIASECNMSPRTVQRALNDLEEAGFLERESRFHDKGGQRSNLYKLKCVEGKEEKTEIEEVEFKNYVINEEPISVAVLVQDSKHNEVNVMMKIQEMEQNQVDENEVCLSRSYIISITKGLKAIKTSFLKWCHGVYDRFSPLEL